jgi:hypothetical protein
MESTHDVPGWRDGAATDATDWPTFKQRTAVHRAVQRLLDSLAPERAPARVGQRAADGVDAAVQRVRSPRGCILQGAARAVSVSWFAAADTDATLGELQVIVWRGVVSRPGAAARAAGGAEPIWRAVLRPVKGEGDAWGWRGVDDRVFESAALAARCQAFVEEPLTGTAPTGGLD